MFEKLSRLDAVDLRDVWDTEAQHFTPWLAEEDNLRLLGATLRMGLEIEGVEISGEGFRADILCKNEDGTHVLIENQLGETDYSHLGQILTYAAGLNVQTVIWIAKKFKDEHRAALDRLNEITDEHYQYFGVEIKVWKIGDSARAPQFEVVSSPNNWRRVVSRNRQREINKNLVVKAIEPPVQFYLTGTEIREARKELGLSQADLAEKLGLQRSSDAAVGDWENERSKVPPRHWENLMALVADTSIVKNKQGFIDEGIREVETGV